MKNYADKDGDTGKECAWDWNLEQKCEECFKNIPCSEKYYKTDEKVCINCGCNTQGIRDPEMDICNDEGIGINNFKNVKFKIIKPKL